MKDFFGRELKIGDVVAFEQPRYRNLVQGEIIQFTPQQVRVKWNHPTYKSEDTYLTYPGHLIKRDA